MHNNYSEPNYILSDSFIDLEEQEKHWSKVIIGQLTSWVYHRQLI